MCGSIFLFQSLFICAAHLPLPTLCTCRDGSISAGKIIQLHLTLLAPELNAGHDVQKTAAAQNLKGCIRAALICHWQSHCLGFDHHTVCWCQRVN